MPGTIEGARDTAAFERYVNDMLDPTLRLGQIVVLDTLSVHKAESIREAITARVCELLFLPPYSRDYTPIEHAFSMIKVILRTLAGTCPRATAGGDLPGSGGHHPRRCGRLARQCGMRLA